MKQRKKYNRYNLEIKEKVLTEYAIDNNVQKLSNKYKIPYTTINSWVEKVSNNQDFIDFRNEKKKEFISLAWDNIKVGNQLLNSRLNRALNQEEELEQIIELVKSESLSSNDKKLILNKIKKMRIENISQISTVLGTLYDKQALAGGDVTSREEQVIKKFEDF